MVLASLGLFWTYPIALWQEEDEFIVEGLLNISWGLRRPIRLQMQDDNERIRPPPSSSSWHSGCNLGAQGWVKRDRTGDLPEVSGGCMCSQAGKGYLLPASLDQAPVPTPPCSRLGMRRKGHMLVLLGFQAWHHNQWTEEWGREMLSPRGEALRLEWAACHRWWRPYLSEEYCSG